MQKPDMMNRDIEFLQFGRGDCFPCKDIGNGGRIEWRGDAAVSLDSQVVADQDQCLFVGFDARQCHICLVAFGREYFACEYQFLVPDDILHCLGVVVEVDWADEAPPWVVEKADCAIEHGFIYHLFQVVRLVCTVCPRCQDWGDVALAFVILEIIVAFDGVVHLVFIACNIQAGL